MVVVLVPAHALDHIFNFPIDENEKENENILFSRWYVRMRCYGLILVLFFLLLLAFYVFGIQWTRWARCTCTLYTFVYRYPFYMRIKSPCCPVKIIYKLFMPTSPSPTSPPPTAATLLVYGWRIKYKIAMQEENLHGRACMTSAAC